ncbi:MAG: amino acid permease C-terminal domain-containing protein, partial [Elusimicrobia bacterium]|nr:amino acid permease C-terminal domain-containing protein [Elusimicrobiota bacterium]
RCPMVPLVPILGIVLCALLMFSLPVENWLRLVVWLALGFVIYFAYGRRHSVLARRRAAASPQPVGARLQGSSQALPEKPGTCS